MSKVTEGNLALTYIICFVCSGNKCYQQLFRNRTVEKKIVMGGLSVQTVV
jgi:hypothetical protein